MLPGPVFTLELFTTARRGRLYVVRTLYAMVLFVILLTIHTTWLSAYEGELPWRMVKWFALSVLVRITIGQGLCVLILTPALVADVIADEKRRKTLHYLLASRLSGAEIVLGKLMARMLYLGVLLGVSLPLMSLLVLLGGIDPRLVWLGVGSTLSTAWFLAALSSWVSTIARRPREALFITYGLECLWLFLGSIVGHIRSTGRPVLDDLVLWLGDWVGASSPVEVYRGLFSASLLPAGTTWDGEALSLMIGLQVTYGAALALLAAVQLRPIGRRQEGEVPAGRGLRALLAARRLRSHPGLGDLPMIWKELHTVGARGTARFVGWLLSVIGGGFLAYYAVWYGLMAYLELFHCGYGWPLHYPFGRDRGLFCKFLQLAVPLLYVVGIVKVAASAASAITAEHEEDTWISLTMSDLSGREIIVAKLLGSLWRVRRVVSLTGLIILAGIGAGSVHVLALPAVFVALAIYGWFAAALGIWVSIQLRSTWQAQSLTIASLVLINVIGHVVINSLPQRRDAPLAWPGCTPYEVGKLVLTPAFFQELSQVKWPRFWRLWEVDDSLGWLALSSIMSLVGYAVLAALLSRDCLRLFEIVAGRARRPRSVRSRELGHVSATDLLSVRSTIV